MLEVLLGEEEVESFLNEALDCEVFLSQSKTGRTWEQFVSVDEISRFFAKRNLKYGEIGLIVDGRIASPELVDMSVNYIPGEKAIDLQRLAAVAARSRCSIVINNCAFYFDGLQELTRSLSEELMSIVHANIYISPPGGAGFDVHWDTHDVFVLQLSGSKQWSLYESQVGLALSEEVSTRLRSEELSSHSLSQVVLDAGDLMYLPRGIPHSAKANDRESIHVTLGVQRPIVGDIYSQKLSKLRGSDSGRKGIDPRALRSKDSAPNDLPTNVQLIDADDWKEFRDRVHGWALQGQPSTLSSDWLLFYLQLRDIPDDVKWRTTFGASDVVRSVATISLRAPTKRLQMPISCWSVVERICALQEFQMRNLEAVDSLANCRVIIKRLAEEGFIVPLGES